MHYDPSIEREKREDRQLAEWLRANPATPKPTLTVSEFGGLLRTLGHDDHTAHAWRQVCELVRDDDEDMVMIRSDMPLLHGVMVVKDKESDNG